MLLHVPQLFSWLELVNVITCWCEWKLLIANEWTKLPIDIFTSFTVLVSFQFRNQLHRRGAICLHLLGRLYLHASLQNVRLSLCLVLISDMLHTFLFRCKAKCTRLSCHCKCSTFHVPYTLCSSGTTSQCRHEMPHPWALPYPTTPPSRTPQSHLCKK